MMAGRRLQALCLVLVLFLSTTAAPASAQADDPKQPSVDNPHMHFWGTSQLDQCWTHFDVNGSDGSSVDGYGMKTFSQGTQVEVDISCRIQSGENFKQDMWLNENGSINIELSFRIFSADCTDNSECKDLTLTLWRGNTEIAQSITSQETVNNYEDFTINWNIPINETMYRWNKSGEEPVVQVEYSAPGVTGTWTLIPVFPIILLLDTAASECALAAARLAWPQLPSTKEKGRQKINDSSGTCAVACCR